MTEKKWYSDGLRFECSECGDCCTGAPGYVWVNQEEIVQLAAQMQMTDVDEFERQYVRKVGIRKSLVEFPNGDCVFFDNEQRSCQVYQSRPRQCRTWPFWDSNLRSPADWERTCESCPGSGKGTLHQIETIEQRRVEIRV